MFLSTKYLMIFIIIATITMICSAINIEKQHPLIENKIEEPTTGEESMNKKIMEKRRLFSLYNILNNNNKRSINNFDFEGRFDSLPVNTRSLEGIRNNCYFSPIQCYYIEERK